MPEITQIAQTIVEEFALFDNPMDKYEYIIELGKNLPALDPKFQIEDNLVKGCQSKVWLTANFTNQKVVYLADSNTIITKGIIAILIRLFSQQSPHTILSNDLSLINAIDLRSHLSSQRSNGLTAMLQMMKQYALVFYQQVQIDQQNKS